MNNFLDIETIPDQSENALERIAETIKHPAQMKVPATIEKWEKEKKPEAIEKAWRDTSFDGGFGEVISVSFAIADCEIESFYRGLDEPESDLLSNAFEAIRNANPRVKPFFIGHNIPFDLRFLFRRAVVLGINPGFDLPFAGRHGQQFFDNAVAWCGYKDYIKQDTLCKVLGIKGKPDDIDGSKVWDFVKAGKVERVAEYNRDDVDKVRQIYNKLNYA